MSTECVIVARRGAALWLTINRPEQHNALSNDVLAALRQGVSRARSEDGVRVLVITGAGSRAFCAGGDLTQMSEADGDLAEHEGRSQLAGLLRDLWLLGKPTVARVHGYALAGGCGLAAACDFVVATESSTFGLPESKVGLWPYMVTIPLLMCMPPKKLLRLMITARRFDAAEAERSGIVSDLVTENQLDTRVDELVDELLRVSPQAVALGRTAFHQVALPQLDVQLLALQHALTVNLGMSDAIEGLAAFVERRDPAWATSPDGLAP
jgi:enoyl-CoA hydratase/carnithine racemase